MISEIIKIANFMGEAFLHIWPYLLVTIPLAVAVNMSGASKYIKRAFDARPITAILLATIVGAFSPFCSCGVIPVIAALLISGVPLAPVMSFWIASPSMDPEIFFLSVGTIGWNLAVWRLVGTLLLSLSAGFITHFAITPPSPKVLIH
ncbi:MAG: permease [Deltaproteobacteria bacterium]|nr:permease [Deltaproteobacteria bacterium]